MKHSLPKYLEDIRLSIGDIESYIGEIISSKELENNQLLFDAVCRRFGIIGEALYKANRLERNLSITDKDKIIGLRHIIVHDYDVVRVTDIWLIIKNQLPVLKSEIGEILKKFE